MTFSQYLRSLRARWLGAAAVVSLAMLLAAVLSLVLPQQYTATAAVLIDLKSQDPLNPAGFLAQQASAYMSTQLDVIQSERVVRRVIAGQITSPPDAAAPWRAKWQESTRGVGDFESWLGEQLLRKLEIRPTRESGVIHIAYSAPGREQAAQMANAFMQAYIDTSLELRVQPAQSSDRFFEERNAQLRSELEAAQQRLSAFQRDNALVALNPDERLDIETTRLNELSSQLVSLQALGGESGSRQAQARNNVEQAPEVLSSALVSGLSADLARQETRLSEMSTRLGDQHPAIQELRANVRQLRGQIATESRRIAASLGVNNAVNQSRIAQTRAALDAQRLKVAQHKQLRDQAQLLQRDVLGAQRNYDAVAVRANQADLESRSRLSNIAVLKRATAPALPSSPRLGFNLGLAAVLGTALALAWSLWRELRDRRLRDADDLASMLDLPLLVEVPHAGRASARPGAALGRWLGKTAPALPRPAR